MDRDQIRATLQEMAEGTACPRCGHDGLNVTWRTPDEPVMGFPLMGSTPELLHEVPHIGCPGCGASADGNILV